MGFVGSSRRELQSCKPNVRRSNPLPPAYYCLGYSKQLVGITAAVSNLLHSLKWVQFFANQFSLKTASFQRWKRPSDKEIADIFASVPTQLSFVGRVLVGQVANENWHGKERSYDWSDAIAAVEVLLKLLGIHTQSKQSDLAPWHPGRCAEFIVDGKPVGTRRRNSSACSCRVRAT
jgi:phenylalanyl-tRNA synthetase beta subunit